MYSLGSNTLSHLKHQALLWPSHTLSTNFSFCKNTSNILGNLSIDQNLPSTTDQPKRELDTFPKWNPNISLNIYPTVLHHKSYKSFHHKDHFLSTWFTSDTHRKDSYLDSIILSHKDLSPDTYLHNHLHNKAILKALISLTPRPPRDLLRPTNPHLTQATLRLDPFPNPHPNENPVETGSRFL